jgi:hypothetical protein
MFNSQRERRNELIHTLGAKTKMSPRNCRDPRLVRITDMRLRCIKTWNVQRAYQLATDGDLVLSIRIQQRCASRTSECTLNLNP